MKRKALGLLLFLLIVPLFMGCVQTETTKAATTVTTETTVTTTVEVALGTVTFEVYTSGDDMDTSEVETEYVSATIAVEYFDGDVLFDLLAENFMIAYEESTYGRYLTGISVLTADTDANEYIAFYIDGSYASTGVDATDLVNGAVYQFKLESY